MLENLSELNPVILALLAATMTWLITALGSSIVFFFKKVNKTLLDSMLAFAAGVMIASSFFSLLIPAIENANELKINPLLPVIIGFILGTIVIFLLGKICKKTDNKKSFMLMLSITLHNIPEGLAIGVAFGSLVHNNLPIAAAFAVALGIGIQNFPEGSAISLPLLKEGYSQKKAFFMGQLSAIVEPIAAVIGAFLVIKVKYIQPYMLTFAAAAMIFVAISELIPESQKNEKKELISLVFMIGFIIMMFLDLAFI